MKLPTVRILACFVAGALLLSCSATSDITAFEPLVGADSLAVTLQRTSATVSDMPTLQISGIMHGVDAVWQVTGGACDIASATAARAGSVIEIRLHRGGDPLANCVAMAVGYRYAARIVGLEPGRYEVRFVDEYAQRPPTEIGRSSVVVLQYGLD